MEVHDDDDDLGLIFLYSLPSYFANFTDSLLHSHNTLTLDRFLRLYMPRKR